MFSRYQGRPEEATEKEFEREGDRRWFLTGDTAEMDQEDGTFKILGRTSVDIIKYRTRKGKKIVLTQYFYLLLQKVRRVQDKRPGH